jgi:uncharacterized protein (TIGR03437 family)
LQEDFLRAWYRKIMGVDGKSKESDDDSRVEWTQDVSHSTTSRDGLPRAARLALAIGFVLSLLPPPVFAQTASRLRADWRRVGNSSLLLGLPSPAGGPVERVWFEGESGRVLARLSTGQAFSTADFETWQPAQSAEDSADNTRVPAGARPPEAAARMAPAPSERTRVYAVGLHVWRSEDGGVNWANVTSWKGASILGGRAREIAVDPRDADRIAVAAETGLWMSVDGGRTWRGLNEGLPNLPVARILSAPQGVRGLRIALASPGAEPREAEWAPGQRTGWTSIENGILAAESDLRDGLALLLGVRPSAIAVSQDSIFAGAADGRIWASLDSGRTWRQFQPAPPAGAVERIWSDPADSRFALAALSGVEGKGARVLRTLNAGAYWDDITANLPDGAVHGITADRAAGVIYVATDRGVFATLTDLRSPVPATPWTPLPDPVADGRAMDVRLDDTGLQLFVALYGHGVYSTPAPHRARQPLLVHSADYSQRAAAPGALLSLVGAQVREASVNRATAPVLSATPAESQIQVPFEVAGATIQVALSGADGRWVFPMALRQAAPSILVDREGAPVLVDADTGVQVDLMNPARTGMRLQVLATGLGRVRPEWPTGLPAPLENPPVVDTPVRALLDGRPVEVVRATLAPGYIGYYLVELQLPDLLDSGASELLIEAAGQPSNRVRLYVAR